MDTKIREDLEWFIDEFDRELDICVKDLDLPKFVQLQGRLRAAKRIVNKYNKVEEGSSDYYVNASWMQKQIQHAENRKDEMFMKNDIIDYFRYDGEIILYKEVLVRLKANET